MSRVPGAAAAAARILIVDDERHNRQLLEVMLGPEGFTLASAESGAEALAMVAQHPPDLILLDVMMPGLDGYQVAARLKANLATKNIPIIMVTVRDDRDAKMLGLNAGAEDFLSKPVDRAELKVRVRNLLRLKAYADYHDEYGQMLEGEVGSRAADLVESERLYRATFDAAPVGIAHVGLDGRWLRVNQRLCDLLGYTRNELQGVGVQELLQAAEVAGEAESFRLLAAGTLERHVVDEKRYRRRDGSFVWVRVNMSVHRDTEGRCQHFISVIEDITERMRAEQQARKEELKFRRFVETSHEGICIMDDRGRLLFANRRLEVMFGFEPGEMIGKSRFELVGDDAGTPLQEGVTGQTEGSREYRLRRKDGVEVWALGTADPIIGEDGVRDGTFAMLMDITERKRAEEALRRSEEQLRQSQKMEAIGSLAGGVAHDFNNLLSIVLSYSELLADDLKEGDPMRADLEEIRAAGMRAVDLTRQLLAFSRQQVLQPKIVNLGDIVVGMERMLRRLLGEDVELSSSGATALPEIMVDPGQMEQIIMNLAVNARDAMPCGGKLAVDTAEVFLDEAYSAAHVGVKPGPHVMLAVSDSGVGMDLETQAHMFEPFFTTKVIGKGTGLGLATVFGIVRQSGGTIWVESEPGRGTTFKIYFPTADRALVARASVPLPGLGTLRGSETILLVEDEERVRVLARTILRKYGYNVLEAENVGDAILLCEQHTSTIHLLLTDVVMPRMSGRQLAERLVLVRPGMKVLYMSGYTDDAVMRHGILDSTVAFVQKPITPEALARKVRESLGSSSAN
ncbi:MAG: Blue-light-activated protein [Myxococcales bacterium]|nr:Blue-light-activated protein [Myxococcales bacterium]